MAYKPKYAQSKGNAVPREPEQHREPPRSEQKKMGRGMLVLFILLGLVVVPLSSFLTVRFMGDILKNVGRPKPAAQTEVADMQIQAFFDEVISENVAAARNAVRPAELAEQPEQPEEVPPVTEAEEIPPVRKEYQIAEGTLVAPEPNQALFNKTDDRQVMAKVLHDARWLLDGQSTFFQPNQQLYEKNSFLRYYLDDSIFALAWQEEHDGWYYLVEEDLYELFSQYTDLSSFPYWE